LVPRQPYQNANTQNVKGQNPKFKFDGFAKSREMSFSVIPANPGPARRTRLWQAGRGPGQAPESSLPIELQNTWTPFFNGVTTFCRENA